MRRLFFWKKDRLGERLTEGRTGGDRIFRRAMQAGSTRWAVYVLAFMIGIAVFADFLANDKPWICKIEGKVYFPILRSYGVRLGLAEWPESMVRADWHTLDYEWERYVFIPYNATQTDANNARFKSPGGDQIHKNKKFWHYLGTDQIGRDVAAGMVYGTRVALSVALIAMLIAGFIGILLGGMAGFFGDHQLQVNRWGFWAGTIGFLLGLFWAFESRYVVFWESVAAGHLFWQVFLALLIVITSTVIFGGAGRWFARAVGREQRMAIPVDFVVLRMIEVLNSIPGLLLLMGLLALFRQPSIYGVMVVIGMIGWTSIARYTRAEFLRIRELTYLKAGRGLGYGDMRLLFRHALPNAIGPIFVTIAFGMASAILLESTLSFLGIGVSSDIISWGFIMRQGQNAVDAWWLAIFPGIAIFLSVMVFNTLGEGFTNALTDG